MKSMREEYCCTRCVWVYVRAETPIRDEVIALVITSTRQRPAFGHCPACGSAFLAQFIFVKQDGKLQHFYEFSVKEAFDEVAT